MHETATLKVGRAQHLAHIPVTTAFVFQYRLRELLDLLREVTIEDHLGRPQVTRQVRRHVSGKHEREERAGQRREQQIVLEQLLAHLLPGRLELCLQLFLRLGLVDQVVLEFEALYRHKVLEEGGQNHRQDRVQDKARLPLLIV